MESLPYAVFVSPAGQVSDAHSLLYILLIFGSMQHSYSRALVTVHQLNCMWLTCQYGSGKICFSSTFIRLWQSSFFKLYSGSQTMGSHLLVSILSSTDLLLDVSLGSSFCPDKHIANTKWVAETDHWNSSLKCLLYHFSILILQ
jgi:hypothetical protein